MVAGHAKRGPAPELLAPAGSLEAFEAAVRAGADAVYVGAPACNARNLGRDLSLAEIAAMREHARNNRVRLYIAMNSLVREDELDNAFRLLAAWRELDVDGVIVQDLGLVRLARRHFPHLPLHASTLMGTHNSLGVRRLAALGFSRVVLARELTLEEIGRIAEQADVELEVFVHGAMCFSYSGFCLLSSFYGGRSGLRGECVQPCRRQYRWRGGQRGYALSMRDLDGADAVEQLWRCGVRSLKIEGRMRPAAYVERVVAAYRLLLDHPGDGSARREAAALLARAGGRPTASGFFFSPRPKEALLVKRSGNTGLFVGRVQRAGGGRCAVRLRQPVRLGDRLRLHRQASGDRQAFTVRHLESAGRRVRGARPGTVVWLTIAAEAGDELYKVAEAEDRRQRSSLDVALFRPLARRLAALPVSPGTGDGPMPPGDNKSRPAGQRLRWYVRSEIGGRPAGKGGRIVLLDRRSFSRLPSRPPQGVALALPPVIDEADIPWYHDICRRLTERGWRRWQIGQLGHLELFAGAGPLEFWSAATLNVLNSEAARLLAEQGVRHIEVAVETDRQNLAALVRRCPELSLGMTVRGFVPLAVSRLAVDRLPAQRIFSPKHEELAMVKRFGRLVVIAADRPLDLTGLVDELARLGLAFVVDDLLCRPAGRADGRRRGRSGRRQRGSTFNYLGRLR